MRLRPLSFPPVRLALSGFAVLLGCTALVGCPTDDDDDATPPEGFCISVAGGGVFDKIQDAIDAAPAGGVIQVCNGRYDENLDIDKPITIAGQSREGVIVTGGGRGTILQIDQVDGPVNISRFTLLGPDDELGTIRGVRITQSTEVTLNEMRVEFEPDSNGIGRGLSGVEASQSNVVINDLETFRIGLSSETGGTAILAQTASTLEVHNSSLVGNGAFGIRVIDSVLAAYGTEISTTSRPSGAEQFDSDGSAIFIEGNGTQEMIVEGCTIQNGSFVGIWNQTNKLTVTASTISSFAYGIYVQGDAGAASGRELNISGTSFDGIAQWPVLSNANTSISSSQITALGGFGVRVIAPLGEISVSSTTVTGATEQAMLVGGNQADGNAATVSLVGNTITDVVRGNAMMATDVDTVIASDNIIDGVDHGYFRDPENPQNDGLIVNGYGLACFRVTDCTLSGNEVIGAEFANVVIVDSGFSMTEDLVTGAWWNAIHIEESQGTLTDVEIRDNLGTAVYLSESSIIATGVTIENTSRGPFYRDIDEDADPLPEEIVYSFGGWGLENLSLGAPSYLEFRDGSITNSAYGGMISQRAQVFVTGNTFTDNGVVDEVNTFSQGAVYISQGDDNAVSGPVVQNNVMLGSDGSNMISVFNAPDSTVRDNIVCGARTGGIMLSNADGTVVDGNVLGAWDGEGNEACDDLAWNYNLRISQTDLETIGDGPVIEDNELLAPLASYGVQVSGLGPVLFEGNTIVGGSVGGIDVAVGFPSILFQDQDGDGMSPWSGDCDDTEPTTGGSAATELPGDGIDNDCDGVTDDGVATTDADLDGFTIAGGDCDDTDPLRSPAVIEVLGNWLDDDCDGVADVDADFPVPVLTMIENTITGGGTGIRAQGGVVHLSEDSESLDPPGNLITGTTGAGVELFSWNFGAASAVGTLTASPATTISDAGTDCVRISAIGATATLTGAQLTGCEGNGVAMVQAGFLTATDVLISGVGNAAVSATNGTAVLDGVLLETPLQHGIYVDGSGDVTGVDVIVTGAGARALRVANGAVELTGGALESLGTSVVDITGGGALLTGTSLVGTGGDAVQLTGGALTTIGITASGALGDGISATGGTLAISGGTMSNNGGWGVNCSGPVALLQCLTTATGNTSGAFLQTAGCDEPADAPCTQP